MDKFSTNNCDLILILLKWKKKLYNLNYVVFIRDDFTYFQQIILSY